MVLRRAWDCTQSGEKSPQGVWSSRVECHFTDTVTEPQKAGWFLWCYRRDIVQQGSGIWTYISVFPSDDRLQRLFLVLGVFRQPVIRSLVEAGWTDLCSWLSLVPCQGQPAPAVSIQTISPRPTMTSISLSPPTFFPDINMLFQTHNLRCRFGVLPEISDLEGEDSVFKISSWEFPSAWRMIWGQFEIGTYGRHLLLLPLLTRGKKANTVNYYYYQYYYWGTFYNMRRLSSSSRYSNLNVQVSNKRA